MARYTDSVCRLCRREGMKLYLKGDRCFTDKCAITKRAYAPGQHGSGRRKLSDFGIQLRENKKQKDFTVYWNPNLEDILKLPINRQVLQVKIF